MGIRNSTDTINMRIHDLNLRYSNCYTKIDGVICKIIRFHVSEVNPETILIKYVPGNEMFESNRYVDYDTDVIHLETPKLGYFNLDKSVVFAQRKVRRDSGFKFIRGLSPDVLDFRFQDHHIYCTSSYYVLEALLNYYQTPFKDAIDKLYSFEIIGIALNRNLALKVDHNINRIILFSREVPIGVYVHLKKRIRLFTNSFNNELDTLEIPYDKFNDVVKYHGGDNSYKVNSFISHSEDHVTDLQNQYGDFPLITF